MNIEQFLADNRLRKTELASYLGIVPSSISAFIAKGELPDKHLPRILSNPYGWDVSALLDGSAPAQAENPLALAIETLQNECEALRGVIARQDEIIARFDAFLRLYMEKDGEV